jgi:hypothetical protein
MNSSHEIYQRDDGHFEIGLGDDARGPFESREFALRVASGNPPAPAKRANFRRIEIGGRARMTHPPDPQNKRDALAGAPSWISNRQLAENIETKEERQIRSLRSRLAIGYSLAVSLAPLIWGMPR